MDILHRVGIKASPAAVYAALTTRDGLAAWWTRDTRDDVDGVIAFRFHAGGVEIGGFDIAVLDRQPATRLLWEVVGGPEEWIGTRIDWRLRRDDEWCIVVFAHSGWRAPVEFMHHCSTKWALFLMSLKALLETGVGAPSPDDVKIDNWN